MNPYLPPRLGDALCASCGGRVAEARCRTCQAALEQVQSDSRLPAGPVLVAALALLVVLLALTL